MHDDALLPEAPNVAGAAEKEHCWHTGRCGMNDDLKCPLDDISEWCVVGNLPVVNQVDCV